VTDSAGQKLAYVYFENEPGRRNPPDKRNVVPLTGGKRAGTLRS